MADKSSKEENNKEIVDDTTTTSANTIASPRIDMIWDGFRWLPAATQRNPMNACPLVTSDVAAAACKLTPHQATILKLAGINKNAYWGLGAGIPSPTQPQPQQQHNNTVANNNGKMN